MSQVLTPEEVAALFEGLRGFESGPDPPHYHAPRETTPRGRVFSEPNPIFSFPTISAWMMVLADLRWPHL
jgi:hypothetical protein